jgi:protoporphyrinogen/coproporphyrinogen III oxidase
MPERHIVIVGGGISGLSAAYHLMKRTKQEGIPLRVTLVERKTVGRKNSDGQGRRLRR